MKLTQDEILLRSYDYGNLSTKGSVKNLKSASNLTVTNKRIVSSCNTNDGAVSETTIAMKDVVGVDTSFTKSRNVPLAIVLFVLAIAFIVTAIILNGNGMFNLFRLIFGVLAVVLIIVGILKLIIRRKVVITIYSQAYCATTVVATAATGSNSRRRKVTKIKIKVNAVAETMVQEIADIITQYSGGFQSVCNQPLPQPISDEQDM